MSEIITACTTLFKTVFDAFVSKPFHVIIMLLLALIAWNLASNNSVLAQLSPSVGVEQARLQRVMVAEGLIPNLLDESREKIDADRILVRRYHNGKVGISGIPFTYVQTEYASVRPGAGLADKEAWQSYPISTMSKTLAMMYTDGDVAQPHCITVQDGDVPDQFFKYYLNRYEVATLLQCPLQDGEGQIVGYIAAGYTKHHDVTPTDIKALNGVGQKVVKELIKIDPPRPWWRPF